MYKLENYNIIGEKYKGGMGEVYHLYHKEWNIDVAYKQPLKELLKTKEDKERFYQECERWIGLGIHPNIVQLYFFNEENHIPGAFMEWMNQGSLLDYINSQELYQGTNQEIILRILDIAIQSAKGLHYAHSQGILHLDVKPANILLDEDSVKITDFGISSFLNQKSSGYTLLYCAPEQQVQGTVNERTDIYCWAVTLLHMLVKEAIWFDGYVAGLAYDQYLDDSPLDIPESLRVLLGQCLESDNEKRIHDFKIVIEKLINIYNTLSFKEYSRDDEKYASISLDAYNNTAISYYHLGYKEKAGMMWLRGYWHNLYHISSYYNYQLYLYRHQGSMDAHFFDTQLKSRQLKESLSDKEGYQQLKQDWYQSVKMNLSLPLKTIDLNKYQLDSKKCILLSYIYNNHILYVNEKAEMYIIDDINKKNMKYKTQLIQAHKATISKNKRYLALAYHDPKISDTYEIRVIDLKEMKYILTISGKEKIYTLKSLSFSEQYDDYPRLIANFSWRILDWKIKTHHQKYDNNSHENTYHIITDEIKPPVHSIKEGEGYCLVVFSDNQCAVYDEIILDKISQRLSVFISQYKIKKVQAIPHSQYLLIETLDNHYMIYDYDHHCLVAQDEQVYQQISVDQTGEKILILEDQLINVYQIPKENLLKEPIWQIRPFKKTSKLITECKEAVDKIEKIRLSIKEIKEQKRILNQDTINNLISTLSLVADYYHHSFRGYHEYLEIAAKMSCILEPKTITTTRQFTNEDIEIIKVSEDNCFHYHDMPVLELRKAISGVELCLDDYVLAAVPFSYNGVIGISKDYCYLVCDNRFNRNYKYQLISLEWNYE